MSKWIALLVVVIFLTSSPISSLVFELYEIHAEAHEIYGEDDLKEKVIFTYDKELADQIVELVNSIGSRAYVMAAEPCTSSSGFVGRKKVYTIGFNHSF